MQSAARRRPADSRLKRSVAGLSILCSLAAATVARAADLTVSIDAPAGPDGLSLVGADVVVDAGAAAVVHLAGDLLATDLGRVTGHEVHARKSDAPVHGNVVPMAVLIGTLGDGGPVDELVKSGKVDASGIQGQWETFAWQLVDAPSAGVKRALVIVGSDRRGTAYGCTELSKAIGVSPWNWWADVPAARHAQLSVSPGRRVDGPPGVKFRGIFLNDEDWCLRPWASKTFDSELGNLGPKTYSKLFELMLRLRLNYLWPAMHPGSDEFGSVVGNAEAADRWAVVMGASHCEPMLRNNVYWNKANGPWRYDTNRDNILKYWTESVDQRGNFEAVWTLGIRGIHDTQMQGPPGIPDRVKMVEGIMTDQRKLIDAKVTKRYGPPAECLVPYKEVLPLYDAGMKVPDDVTLLWPDDNFGYVRHLPTADERKRSGGNGVYYHVSYLGPPRQSYLWVQTTSPALIWEELHKAWANDAGRIWVLNVGDLKPAEMAVDFYAQLGWSPDRFGPDAQEQFQREFFTATFGAKDAGPLAKLATEYYRLAAVRRPESFEYQWLNDLSQAEQDELMKRYAALAEQESAVAKLIPPGHADAYFEMVGYAARMLAATGQLYLHDVAAQRPGHPADLAAAKKFYAYIEGETTRYNEQIAGGKWRRMMSMTPHEVDWPTDVGGKHKPRPVPATPVADRRAVTIDAAAVTGQVDAGTIGWRTVAGLGHSGRAITVLPLTSSGEAHPSVDYAFDLPNAADTSAIQLAFLPTMRSNPSSQLRLAVSIDGGPGTTYAVPGGDAGDERTGPRKEGVLNNRVELPLAAAPLPAGHHTIRLTGIDTGVVLDQIELPPGTMPGRAK